MALGSYMAPHPPPPVIIRILPLLLVLCTPYLSVAQDSLTFDAHIPVQKAGIPLSMPWVGGLNAPQFSSIDLNQDGLMDLFLFDRAGDRPIFLLNTGTADQPLYSPTRAYDNVHPFPLLHGWALLRDYNCDGKADIFAYTSGAFAVYRNTSDASGLSFTLMDDQVGSNYVPTNSPNLYITDVDLPGIADIDGDGDMDILTFSIWGNFLEYHKNLSMELYGTCDSLVYEVRSRCWGEFQESVDGSSIVLNAPCPDNVANPEFTLGDDGSIRPNDTDRAHSGSAILPLDLDGDGDMDLILGDLLFPHITALINGGTVGHAHMVSKDSLFPSYNQSVNMEQFLGSFYIDIDGDGLRDLVVAPNSASAAENAHGIWFYKNIGTDAAPVFQFQRDNLFQGDMLDFGEGARPVLFDHNGDGLMDLVVANEGYFQPGATYQGRLALLENIGTATAPAFNLVTTDYGQLAGQGFGPGVHPAFGDVNGDGKQDMILGDLAGNLHLFLNTSSGPVAQFQLSQPLITNDGGTVIDVGANATPQLFDLDDDGLLDLIVGERNGNLNYYRNAGTAEAPSWHLESQSLGGVLVNEYWSTTGYSVPFLYSDDEGEKLFYSGSEVGGIHRYDGITGNETGIWNLTDSIWKGFHEGIRTAIALYDFTGDGKLDAILGNYRGGLSFWSSGSATEPSAIRENLAVSPFSLAPNPAQGYVDIRWHAPLTSSLQVDLMDGLGRTVRTLTMDRSMVRMELDGLSSGLYTVLLRTPNATWTQRLALVQR